jgi:gliding motility-associated-like protein
LAIDSATGIINPSASAEGVYTITNTIAAAGGCGVVTATFDVTILPAPIGTFSYAGPYCQNDITDPSPILDGVAGTFSADSSDLVINTATGEIDLSESASGVYTVYNTIAATADCEEVTFSAQVVINATPMFVIVDGCENNTFSATVTPLDDTFDTDSASIVWTFGTATVSTSATFIPTELGTYTITITSADGCINVMTHLVDSTTCIIQKGISPGDGDLNDNFDLTALDVTSLSIFNRYGQEVFSYGTYTDQWYGQDKGGNELPTGTYFYSLERSNGETRTGWVYINRQN